MYCYLGSKFGLAVRKSLASLGVKSSEARWSYSSKSISDVKGYLDWKYNGFLLLVTLALKVDQRRLSSGFCPNSLDILSVESVGMNWKEWP